MSYDDTIQYLYNLQKHGIKFGLSNSRRLLELMGDPQRRFRSVHVAGTNGKGSTSALLAGMLGAAGYRVGLYTSPHLVSFTERIRIDALPVSEERVVDLAARVRARYEQESSARRGSLTPTFFEVTTAMAFTCFAEEGVDIAVIETGMGGRLDATNVIVPLVSVITNIDIEHAEFLGSTLGEIAGEKAGIIKPGVPVVTGAVQPEAVTVIERAAASVSAPLFRMPQDFGPERPAGRRHQVFDYRGLRGPLRGLSVSLVGRHQVGNASLALAAAECLDRSGVAIAEPAMRSGLAETVWEGRLERAAGRPDIFLDGAHNPASARALAAALRELKADYRRLVLLIGILGDKDYRSMLRELLPLADAVIVTRPDYSRALDVRSLAGEIRAVHAQVESTETVREAVTRARSSAGPDDCIVITGSLYTVGDARAVLRPHSGQNALQGLKG